MPAYGGAFGYSPFENMVCGALAHSDKDGLIWFNGSLAVDKGDRADEIYNFEYYSTDDNRDKIGKWSWEENHLEEMCWQSTVASGSQLKRLTVDEKRKVQAFVMMYKEIRKGNMTVARVD